MHRIDTYLAIILDHPPNVRYQELDIPLPKSRELWEAQTEQERRTLQWSEPAGREKALFSHLVRDLLASSNAELPYRLTGQDYHLTLCALQSLIWEAAREAHSNASDDIVTKLGPGVPIFAVKAHLNARKLS